MSLRKAAKKLVGAWSKEPEDEPDSEDYTHELRLALAMSITERRQQQAAYSAEQTRIAEAKRKSMMERTDAAEALSCKYWSQDSLEFGDVLLDGFYDCWDSFKDVAKDGEFPSLSVLRRLPRFDDDTREVLLVHHDRDERLCELASEVTGNLPEDASDAQRVGVLARVVCRAMGGNARSSSELAPRWRAASAALKRKHHSVVVPLGELAVGRLRHRALLFKVLADDLQVKCRLLRGGREGHGPADDKVGALVRVGAQDCIVDLMRSPGRLIPFGSGDISRILATPPHSRHGSFNDRDSNSPWRVAVLPDTGSPRTGAGLGSGSPSSPQPALPQQQRQHQRAGSQHSQRAEQPLPQPADPPDLMLFDSPAPKVRGSQLLPEVPEQAAEAAGGGNGSFRHARTETAGSMALAERVSAALASEPSLQYQLQPQQSEPSVAASDRSEPDLQPAAPSFDRVTSQQSQQLQQQQSQRVAANSMATPSTPSNRSDRSDSRPSTPAGQQQQLQFRPPAPEGWQTFDDDDRATVATNTPPTAGSSAYHAQSAERPNSQLQHRVSQVPPDWERFDIEESPASTSSAAQQQHLSPSAQQLRPLTAESGGPGPSRGPSGSFSRGPSPQGSTTGGWDTSPHAQQQQQQQQRFYQYQAPPQQHQTLQSHFQQHPMFAHQQRQQQQQYHYQHRAAAGAANNHSPGLASSSSPNLVGQYHHQQQQPYPSTQQQQPYHHQQQQQQPIYQLPSGQSGRLQQQQQQHHPDLVFRTPEPAGVNGTVSVSAKNPGGMLKSPFSAAAHPLRTEIRRPSNESMSSLRSGSHAFEELGSNTPAVVGSARRSSGFPMHMTSSASVEEDIFRALDPLVPRPPRAQPSVGLGDLAGGMGQPMASSRPSSARTHERGNASADGSPLAASPPPQGGLGAFGGGRRPSGSPFFNGGAAGSVAPAPFPMGPPMGRPKSAQPPSSAQPQTVVAPAGPIAPPSTGSGPSVTDLVSPDAALQQQQQQAREDSSASGGAVVLAAGLQRRLERSLTIEEWQHDDWEINFGDVALKQKIGSGSYGEVWSASWKHTDVAVKKLMKQDEETMIDFKREVAIMKRLRHPNVVQLMGVCVVPPNLSLVTQFCARGSLFKVLHNKPSPDERRTYPDERRRLLMARDVACGMNYLHSRNPPIVHKDLKSPNLLVDKDWTVKVCDFGLSRVRRATLILTQAQGFTTEWAAPEVLRGQPYNEKSDVFSFGVVLWELTTLMKPWEEEEYSAPQIIGVVGYNNGRLEVPPGVLPGVADLMHDCFKADPEERPDFNEVLDRLQMVRCLTQAGLDRLPPARNGAAAGEPGAGGGANAAAGGGARGAGAGANAAAANAAAR